MKEQKDILFETIKSQKELIKRLAETKGLGFDPHAQKFKLYLDENISNLRKQLIDIYADEMLQQGILKNESSRERRIYERARLTVDRRIRLA